MLCIYLSGEPFPKLICPLVCCVERADFVCVCVYLYLYSAYIVLYPTEWNGVDFLDALFLILVIVLVTRPIKTMIIIIVVLQTI